MSAPATTEQTYFRASLGFKKEIQDDLVRDYHSELIDRLRANGFTLTVRGFTVALAKEFGFCYGVDKAIDMAYETRRKFPEKRTFLTTELIHNPRVNEKMRAMGIRFLTGPHRSGETVEDITKDDVVILPAFGVSVAELKALRERGCILVDTTCGSVVHVWKRVEKYAKDGYTSLIHGKMYHEETIATTSQAVANGGHYIVVRNMEQAELVMDAIAGRRDPESLRSIFAGCVDTGFDPARDLERIGVANQTTMLASESLAIAKRLGETMKAKYGEENLAKHFRSFDTICSATQDRQDAIQTMIAETKLDLMLIVGGYNSSNTNHLVAMSKEKCQTYHIDDAREIVSAEELRHKPYMQTETVVAKDWLPPLPFTLGITAGASTPNRAIGDAIERVAALHGISMPELLEAAGPQAAPPAP